MIPGPVSPGIDCHRLSTIHYFEGSIDGPKRYGCHAINATMAMAAILYTPTGRYGRRAMAQQHHHHHHHHNHHSPPSPSSPLLLPQSPPRPPSPAPSPPPTATTITTSASATTGSESHQSRPGDGLLPRTPVAQSVSPREALRKSLMHPPPWPAPRTPTAPPTRLAAFELERRKKKKERVSVDSRGDPYSFRGVRSRYVVGGGREDLDLLPT